MNFPDDEESAESRPRTSSKKNTDKDMTTDQVNLMNFLKRYGIPELSQESVIFDVIKKFRLQVPSEIDPSADGKNADHAIDTGMQFEAVVNDKPNDCVDVATPEPCEAPQRLISKTEGSLGNSIKQRKTKSANLLKKELDAQGKAASRDFLVKVNIL